MSGTEKSNMIFDEKGNLVRPKRKPENISSAEKIAKSWQSTNAGVDREVVSSSSYRKNYLFDALNEKILKLGNNLKIKENKTMRSFYSIDINHKKRGLVWLEPLESTLTLHLRKGSYSLLDKRNQIKYSKPTSQTFGDYPVFIVTNNDDVEYAYILIEYAYNKL